MASIQSQEELKRYYRIHAQLYDATRWMFLFGRDAILSHQALNIGIYEDATILEVGCGTGRNLKKLCHMYHNAKLVGVDLSAHMLHRAMHATRKCGYRTLLVAQPYNIERWFKIYSPARLVLCSYSLSMFNPGWEEALERAKMDMDETGQIAVVDFHRSRFAWFTRWMNFNHVRMDGHLYQSLHEQFEPDFAQVYPAFGGLWEYFVFIGSKKKAS